jgi:hypothetical protein
MEAKNDKGVPSDHGGSRRKNILWQKAKDAKKAKTMDAKGIGGHG